MSLLKDLHEPRVSLRVDQVDVSVKVVVSERVESLVLLPVSLLLLVLVFLNEMVLSEVRNALNLALALLVELKELLLPIEDFLQELFSAGTSPHLLSRPHLLFKSIESSRLFFAVSENALSFVKLTVHKLIFKQVVPMTLAHKL